MRRRDWLVGAGVIAGMAWASAAWGQEPKPAAGPPLVVRAYPVDDLLPARIVVTPPPAPAQSDDENPFEDDAGDEEYVEVTPEEKFIRMVRNVVAADSWEPTGQARLAIHLGRLLVEQTEANQAAVADLLNRLRHPQPPGQREEVPPAMAMALARVVPRLRIRNATPAQLLEQIGQAWDVRIDVRWDTFGDIGITGTNPGRVSVDLRDATLGAALRAAGSAIAGREDVCDYAIQPDRVLFGTVVTDALASASVLRVYAVRDLLANHDGFIDSNRVEEFKQMNRCLIHPDSWAPTGDSVLEELNGSLIVKAPPRVHRDLAAFLELLRHPPGVGGVVEMTADGQPGGRAASDRVREGLARRIEAVNFNRPTPLGDALDWIGQAGGVSIGVNWGTLGTIGITPTNPEVKLSLKDTTVESALYEVLSAAAGREDVLDFVVSDGMVKISTRDDLQWNKTIRLHNVTDLLDRLDDPQAGERVEEFHRFIRSCVRPDSWAPTGDAGIQEWRYGLLLIQQHQEGHRDVARFFKMLRDPAPRTLADQPPEANRVARAKLRRLGDVDFSRPTPLGDVLDWLGDAAGVDMDANWGALAMIGITQTSPKITLRLRNGTVEEALRRALSAAAGREGVLDYMVRDGVVKVSTCEDLRTIEFLLRYDVHDLVGDGSGDASLYDVDEFKRLLRAIVLPDTWAPTGDALMEWWPGSLIVKQSEAGHRELDALLAVLRSGGRTPAAAIPELEAAKRAADARAAELAAALKRLREQAPRDDLFRQAELVEGDIAMTTRLFDLQDMLRLLPEDFVLAWAGPAEADDWDDDAGEANGESIFGDDDDSSANNNNDNGNGGGPFSQPQWGAWARERRDDTERRVAAVQTCLRAHVAAPSWAPTGDANVEGFRSCLLVKQTPAVQIEVARFLVGLSDATRFGNAAELKRLMPPPPAIGDGPNRGE
ncbi:MAG: hypothetical protein BIFFINMI_01841 [Phycisphaerae bacterium]|nr:hypothetical protein [Phycisphaerae bacterium]